MDELSKAFPTCNASSALARAAPDRPALRSGRLARLHAGVATGRHVVGVDRAPEPVSRASARWWPPYVLPGRSRPGPSALGESPGNWFSDRFRDCRDVDDIY